MNLKNLSDTELIKIFNKEFNRREINYFSCDLCFKIELGHRDDHLAFTKQESLACCGMCASRCYGCDQLVCKYNEEKHEDCITEENFKQEFYDKIEICCDQDELIELALNSHRCHLNVIINQYLIITNFEKLEIKEFVEKCKFDVNTVYKWHSSMECNTILLFAAIDFFCFDMVSELLCLGSNVSYVNAKGYNIIDAIFLAQYKSYAGDSATYFIHAERMLRIVLKYKPPRVISKHVYDDCVWMADSSELIRLFLNRCDVI